MKRKREPVIRGALVVALIETLIVAAVAFGLPISGEQQAALMGVVLTAAPVVPLVVALWQRSKVAPYPPELPAE